MKPKSKFFSKCNYSFFFLFNVRCCSGCWEAFDSASNNMVVILRVILPLIFQIYSLFTQFTVHLQTCNCDRSVSTESRYCNQLQVATCISSTCAFDEKKWIFNSLGENYEIWTWFQTGNAGDTILNLSFAQIIVIRFKEQERWSAVWLQLHFSLFYFLFNFLVFLSNSHRKQLTYVRCQCNSRFLGWQINLIW